MGGGPAHVMIHGDFVTGVKEGYDTAPANEKRAMMIVDTAAKEAWDKKLVELNAAMAAATDVPWEIGERKMYLDLKKSGQRDAAAQLAAVDALAAKFPKGGLALTCYLDVCAPATSRSKSGKCRVILPKCRERPN